MKILATIREFSSIIFNKPNGNDIELRPESAAGDSTANQELILPDLGDGASGTPNSDTFALLAASQVLLNKELTTPIFNGGLALTATSTELNQLDDVSVGGTLSGDIVTIDGSQELTNKTLTTPLVNEAVALTATATELNQLDDVSVGGTGAGDIITTDAIQTLSNKTLDGLALLDADDSHVYSFSPGNLTQSRSVFLPVLGANDTFVFEAHTQTLTNKTLTSPIVNELVETGTSDVYSLPNISGSDTLVSRDSSDTLQNKTISGSNNTFSNIGNTALLAGIDALKIADGSVDNSEYQKLNTVGTDAAGEIVSTDATQTLLNKTISGLKYDEADVALANSIAKNAATIMHLTGAATDLQTMTGGADGDVRVLVNETGSTYTIKENFGAGGFHTGTGADLDILANGSVQVIYEASVDRWRTIGGSGGSGGGLVLATVNSAITASANLHYLVDSSGGAFTITLPAGGAGDVIRFSDDSQTWHTDNVTLQPDSISEKIDGEDCLILDVQGTWVQLMWNGTEWVQDDSIVPTLTDLTGPLTTNSTIESMAIRSNSITDQNGTGAPDFPNGISLSGTDTAIISGSWTPVATGGTNVTTGNLTAEAGFYTQVGNVVTATLNLTIDTTSTGTTDFTVTLPVARTAGNFTSTAQAIGTGSQFISDSIRVLATSGAQTITCGYSASSASAQNTTIVFQYSLVN